MSGNVVRIPVELHSQLIAVKQREGVSVAFQIRAALMQYLRGRKHEGKT